MLAVSFARALGTNVVALPMALLPALLALGVGLGLFQHRFSLIKRQLAARAEAVDLRLALAPAFRA